jgi:peptidylprolyl isomerase
MSAAKDGDTVRVHYTGTLNDGTVFDSSKSREPLEFTIGQPGIIPGFQEVVSGMEPGETVTETVTSEKAYGPHSEEMVVEIDRGRLPDHVTPEIGQHLQLVQPDGQQIVVRVTDLSDETVTLDANHPLAGRDLTFEVDLIEIV